ncbi:hypothetical protein Celaphus_00004126 [Cervus elaphus hippelaphus]|uniref:Uncharacterized protein n=1 Tax=Cervus elaphus hippelaphus TaxID=46360 RepID=A0A212DE05_CEREH|nr:hypothetical protein Celaphus_00004126 [Cervus elaphus hippelaphus]
MWARAPPRRPRSAAHPTTVGCWAARGPSWARPWASMELPTRPLQLPRATQATCPTAPSRRRCTGRW